MKESTLTCKNCDFNFEARSDYCPRCGNILIDDVKCDKHSSIRADGVCVICGIAYCSDCGGVASRVYLCDEHSGYEIYQGMARVFGSSDFVQCKFIESTLIKNSLHPFLYSRKSSPMHLGGTDYSMFTASGDFNGHIINEVKVMVPCSEVLEAEKIITELNLA